LVYPHGMSHVIAFSLDEALAALDAGIARRGITTARKIGELPSSDTCKIEGVSGLTGTVSLKRRDNTDAIFISKPIPRPDRFLSRDWLQR
jgi:hypothetical protein